MILNNKKGKLVIFLVIILIVSITPACATQMGEANGNNSTLWLTDFLNEWTGNNNTVANINETEFYQYQIDRLNEEINNDSDKLTVKIDEFNNIPKWRIFKLLNKAKEIEPIAKDIKTKAQNLENLTNKLNDQVESLGSSFEVDGDSYINNVGNPECEEDASIMAQELTKRLGTNFTVKDVDASELKKGDIVQYLSQGKYPRYLVVQDIKNNTEGLLGNIPIDVPMLVLKGSGDKLIEVPSINKCIQVYTRNEVDTGATLQNTVEVQQEDIDKTKETAQELQNKDQRLEKVSGKLSKTSNYLYPIGGTIIAIGFGLLITPFAPFGAGMIAFGTVIIGYSTLIDTIIIPTIDKTVHSLDDKSDQLYDSANANKCDLNTYTQIEPRIPYIMNITTFDGIFVVKHPPLSDWKELPFMLVKNPEHSDLLPGPGLQFLYGPYEGYTGEDSFEFEFRGKDGTLGHMTVNIHIDPIPVFPIPKEA
ncbi:hypothetical protein [Methanobacterium sp. SMA-27]|uniref:hypothetical protein n=1 Tax=Methanobacterium sp. SMA-27 TaxID=1495336 RepID=UPI00064F2ADF|nr:hypothetical protein [Methanobacterium sp. SMA-27]